MHKICIWCIQKVKNVFLSVSDRKEIKKHATKVNVLIDRQNVSQNAFPESNYLCIRVLSKNVSTVFLSKNRSFDNKLIFHNHTLYNFVFFRIKSHLTLFMKRNNIFYNCEKSAKFCSSIWNLPRTVC